MSDCCKVPTPADVHDERCSVSRTKGKPVDLLTVKALLTETALQRLHNVAHRFCPEPSCDVVYFDATGASYTTRELRVPVWQKAPFGERTICYCFGVTEASIRAEIQTTGRSRAIEQVRAHIAAGRCACEVRNPRGACCLGDIAAAVTRVQVKLRDHVEQCEQTLSGSAAAECPVVEGLERSQQ